MKKLMDITTMAMMVLMILGLILCLFGIDVPNDIMVMEFVIMFVSYKVYQIQVKIERERRRKLRIAKQMRKVRL